LELAPLFFWLVFFHDLLFFPSFLNYTDDELGQLLWSFFLD